jgi:hypothetical protein
LRAFSVQNRNLNSRTIFQENSIFSRFSETLLKKFSHREWLFNQIPIFQISQSIRQTEKVKHFPEKNCAKNYVGKEENEFMEELSKTCLKSINKILLKKDCNKIIHIPNKSSIYFHKPFPLHFISRKSFQGCLHKLRKISMKNYEKTFSEFQFVKLCEC